MQMIDLSDHDGQGVRGARRPAARSWRARCLGPAGGRGGRQASRSRRTSARVAARQCEPRQFVFLDEIRTRLRSAGRARRFGQTKRACSAILLSLIDRYHRFGTKYGPMKTDHLLFIASGAFMSPSERHAAGILQGRLPIRVELRALTEADSFRILSETRANLVAQYKALLGTEEVTLEFTDDAIAEVAAIAAQVNASVENIGARRLQTVDGALLEDISSRPRIEGQTVVIDAAYVRERLVDFAGDTTFEVLL